MSMMVVDLHNVNYSRRFISASKQDKCNCTIVNLMHFFDYHNRNAWSELDSIVANSDIPRLETCFKDNSKYFSIVDRHGNSPIHIAIIFDKLDVFDYLLNSNYGSLNHLNYYGQTPIHIAIGSNSEYYLKELLKQGGDVNLRDVTSCSPLHVAAARCAPKISELLLENAADIDYSNVLGKTALYHACEYGTIDNIYMLLYYGASANIADIYGVLPITALMEQSLNSNKEIAQSHLDCHEVLFNYTFDKEPISLNLKNLIVALKINSPLIPEYLTKVSDLKYSTHDLKLLCQISAGVHPKYFKLFTKKFGYVVKKMLGLYFQEMGHNLTSANVDTNVLQLMKFLTMIFEFRPTCNFIKGSTNYSYIIGYFVGLFKGHKLSKTVLEQVMYFLYSYGLPCELNHVAVLYETFGFNEFVKFLLDFDLAPTFERPKTAMPYLLCNINLTIDTFLDQVRRPSVQHESALKFFSKPKVRNFFGRSSKFKVKLRRLPIVPSLTELARDVTRKHIIKTYQIKKSRDFYQLIKKLPINNVYKKILTYETEIYRF